MKVLLPAGAAVDDRPCTGARRFDVRSINGKFGRRRAAWWEHIKFLPGMVIELVLPSSVYESSVFNATALVARGAGGLANFTGDFHKNDK